MFLRWDSELSAPMVLLILSIPLHLTLAQPCFRHRDQAVAAVALGEVVFPEEALEEEVAEAGKKASCCSECCPQNTSNFA